MPDSKITALASIGTGTDPVNDALVIVDVSDVSPGGMSATGTTKRVSLNNLLASSPTATLASATISGAATVGTTLGVTGVSTFAAGTALLPALTTTGDTNTGIYYPAADTFAVTTAGAERYRVDSLGNLGIGVQPSAWAAGFKAIQIGATSGQSAALFNNGLDNTWLVSNAFFSGGNWNKFASGTATLYEQGSGAHKWYNNTTVASGTFTPTQLMTLDASGNLLVGLTGGNNRVQISGNIGLPNSCIGSFETRGVFSIDVANLFALTGAVWRQCSFLLVYSGVDENLGNPTVLQTVVTLTGLSTYNTISKNDIVGTASVAVSNDTSSGARVTVTVPTGNFGSVYVMLLGGLGATTRPSMTINN